MRRLGTTEDRTRWEAELKEHCASIYDSLEEDNGTEERWIRKTEKVITVDLVLKTKRKMLSDTANRPEDIIVT